MEVDWNVICVTTLASPGTSRRTMDAVIGPADGSVLALVFILFLFRNNVWRWRKLHLVLFV